MRRFPGFSLLSVSCAAAIAACTSTQNLGSDVPGEGGADGAAVTTEGGGANADGGGGQGNDGGTGTEGGGGNDGGVLTGNAPRIVAGGQQFACAITPAGGVKCWGELYWGCLGDGTPFHTDAYTSDPRQVKVITSGVVALAARFRHACALTSGGAVYCWGESSEGATGSDNGTSTPGLVTGLGSGVVEVAAADNHSCARMTNGAVKCWGGNLTHELGNDTVVGQTTMPTDTQVTSGATRLALGADHSCAIVNGSVSCWGANGSGVLGSAAAGATATPVVVPGTQGAIDIAATGTNTCALNANGEVKCWGSGIAPFNATSWTPAGVVALSPGGIYHMCGLTKTGAVLCWGSDSEGELGDGTNTAVGPIGPSMLSATAVGTGDEFTCAMTPSSTVMCFGLNDAYQLGNTKVLPNTYVPTAVVGF